MSEDTKRKVHIFGSKFVIFFFYLKRVLLSFNSSVDKAFAILYVIASYMFFFSPLSFLPPLFFLPLPNQTN